MKRKLQLKQKIMIGAGAGLLGATAIVTPLVVTLSQSHANVLDDLDSAYGIDRTMYNNMKGDLTNKYRSNLEAQHLSDEEINAKMTQLRSSLSGLDRSIQKSTIQANLYVSATTVLMQKAKFDFGVDLVRNSRANWNEVEDMFKGMSNSFDTYMSNHGFDRADIDNVLAMAANQKNDIVAKLKTEYPNDVLGGVLRAKSQLLSCFDTINTEIARWAAEIRLLEFTQDYMFEYKEIVSENGSNRSNRFNVLKDAGIFGEVGSTISNENMNKIFTCYNTVTRQPTTFVADSMIPGYRLIPVFAGTVENPITNEYSIKIDWRAIANSYDKPEHEEAATAHLVDTTRDFINEVVDKKSNVKTLDDFFNRANQHIKLTEYKMLVTDDFESNQLSKTYFNESSNSANIQFVWDQKFNPCYDGFMYVDQSSTEEQTLNLRQLAMTNIAIKANGCEPRLLKDVIDTVEQENYEPKDMVENFVKYCDVVDTVQINRSGNKITSVTNNFTANYKNQVRWDTHGQDSIGATPFGTTMDAKGLKISEVFFEQANSEYNMQRRDVFILLDKEYEKLYDDASDSFGLGMLAVTAHLITGILCVVAACIAIERGIALSAILFTIMAIISAICFVVECVKLALFNENLLEKCGPYVTRANEFNAETELINKVKSKLNEDLDYFVIIDSDHPYDPKTYNEKLEQFRGLDPEEQQKLFTQYHYFKIDGVAQPFFAEADRLKINPTKFREDFAEWNKDYGDYAEDVIVLGFLISGLLILMAIILPFVEKFNRSVEEAAEAEEAGAAGAQAAQQGTLGLFPKMGV